MFFQWPEFWLAHLTVLFMWKDHLSHKSTAGWLIMTNVWQGSWELGTLVIGTTWNEKTVVFHTNADHNQWNSDHHYELKSEICQISLTLTDSSRNEDYSWLCMDLLKKGLLANADLSTPLPTAESLLYYYLLCVWAAHLDGSRKLFCICIAFYVIPTLPFMDLLEDWFMWFASTDCCINRLCSSVVFYLFVCFGLLL